MNWCFLLLAMGGLRLCLENLNKYGIRVNPAFWVSAMIGDTFNTDYIEFPAAYLLVCKYRQGNALIIKEGRNVIFV